MTHDNASEPVLSDADRRAVELVSALLDGEITADQLTADEVRLLTAPSRAAAVANLLRDHDALTTEGPVVHPAGTGRDARRRAGPNRWILRIAPIASAAGVVLTATLIVRSMQTPTPYQPGGTKRQVERNETVSSFLDELSRKRIVNVDSDEGAVNVILVLEDRPNDSATTLFTAVRSSSVEGQQVDLSRPSFDAEAVADLASNGYVTFAVTEPDGASAWGTLGADGDVEEFWAARPGDVDVKRTEAMHAARPLPANTLEPETFDLLRDAHLRALGSSSPYTRTVWNRP